VSTIDGDRGHRRPFAAELGLERIFAMATGDARRVSRSRSSTIGHVYAGLSVSQLFGDGVDNHTF
jgi:hypothetical protein